MPEIVALLPMKGHSERVTGKNLRPMAGRPLYHWIMDSLLATAGLSEVVVDTDSEELADDVTRNFATVTVRERPDDLRGDMVPMHDIVARFVSEHATLDHVLQTHATNPLLSSETLARAIEAYLGDGSHDSLMSVTEWRTRLFDQGGRPLNHDPSLLLRTQDLEPVFEENSNIYIAPRAVVESTGRRIGSNPILFPLDRLESMDIDEEIDFRMVECLMQGQPDV
ncbi:MAG TPA: acylneuraminate cytidylyltransferase family protein [Acidimicrobiia bacterium]|nr:acylneuraminate cytidylyltransferase family protein [Acidimicrobiia bacterium]